MAVYRITKCRFRDNREYVQTGTIAELTEAYRYTLEVGADWSHEKGNKKINQSPKTIKSLVTNLENACNNAAANGYSGYMFTWHKVD